MTVLQTSTALPGKPSLHPQLAPSRSSRALLLQAGSCILFFVVAIAPLLAFKLPPLSDYINHLARCYLIAIDGRDAVLGQFYGIEWQLIPNLAMDLIVPPLAQILNIYTAGKVFLVLTMLMLAAGPHVIHYALFRRWSLGPLVAMLFLYNGATIAGTVNYLFGVGVALFGIAAWIRLRQAPLLRAAVSGGFALALYLCHFGALGLYGVALVGIEMWLVRFDSAYRQHWRSSLATFLVPLLIVPVLALAGPGGNDLVNGPIQWTLYDKLRALFFVFESQSISRIPDIIFGMIAAGVGFWAWRQDVVRLHPAGVIITLVGFAAFIVTPVQIMSAWGADVRQPLGYVFILAGFLDWRLPTPRAQHAAVLALLGLLVARTGVVEYAWDELNATTEDVQKSLSLVKPGSAVLVAEMDGRYDHWSHYLPCTAIIERSSLCSLAFSDPRQQVLVVKPPYRAITGGFNDDPPKWHELVAPTTVSPETPSGRIYWKDWTRNYDYLYVLATKAGDPAPAPDFLTKIYDGGNFRLYAIKR